MTIEGLNKCKNLKRLILNRNEISIIPEGAFDGLVNLEHLDLAENQIKKIENLEPLSNLQILIVDNNKIETIENISHMTKLEEFKLYNNKISQVNFLDGLTNLQ